MKMKTKMRMKTWLWAIGLSTATPGLANTIDFEGISPGVFFNEGTTLTQDAKLGDQFLASHGVKFASKTRNYVALVALGTDHATSGVMGIGAASASDTVTYAEPVFVSFHNPINPTKPATTASVSIRGDQWATQEGGRIELRAYDVNGGLLAEVRANDKDKGATIGVVADGIHTVEIFQSRANIAFDDLSFGPLTH